MIAAIFYAVIRTAFFPNIAQFEHILNAAIIVFNFIILFWEKQKKSEKGNKNNKKERRNSLKLDSISKRNYGQDYDTTVLEQWKTCVEMANSNTEKRTSSNNIFITINAALLAVVSFSLDYKSIILSVVGIAVCVVWLCSIESYKNLSSVKYHIVNEIELRLPLKPFTYEWNVLKTENKYVGLTKIEKTLPWLFIFLYVLSVFYPVLKWLPTIICTCNGG